MLETRAPWSGPSPLPRGDLDPGAGDPSCFAGRGWSWSFYKQARLGLVRLYIRFTLPLAFKYLMFIFSVLREVGGNVPLCLEQCFHRGAGPRAQQPTSAGISCCHEVECPGGGAAASAGHRTRPDQRTPPAKHIPSLPPPLQPRVRAVPPPCTGHIPPPFWDTSLLPARDTSRLPPVDTSPLPPGDTSPLRPQDTSHLPPGTHSPSLHGAHPSSLHGAHPSTPTGHGQGRPSSLHGTHPSSLYGELSLLPPWDTSLLPPQGAHTRTTCSVFLSSCTPQTCLVLEGARSPI